MVEHWLIIILCVGIGTFLLRASFIFLMEYFSWGERATTFLKNLPPAVLAALLASQVQSIPLYLIPVALFTFFIAWRGATMVVTLGTGLTLAIILNLIF